VAFHPAHWKNAKAVLLPHLGIQHCTTLLNRDDAPMHWPVLDNTAQGFETMEELDALPTLDKVNAAMKSPANN